MRLAIQPFGNMQVEVVESLAEDLRTFDMEIEIRNAMSLPLDAYDPKRSQYLADAFMDALSRVDGDRVLGVTAVDLYAEPLNFIFGQARMSGQIALISTARLVERDKQKFRDRVAKEAVHELGHTFGLSHCNDPRCVMFFSNSLADTDRKGKDYCHKCLGVLPKAWSPRRT